MKTVRPLAKVVALVAGESLTSYVERLAAMHKVDLLVMLDMLGIIENEKYEPLNGYGVLLNNKQREKFSTATKIREENVSYMLFSIYNGIAFDLKGTKAGDAEAFRKITLSEWAYFSGSHACPHCLREDEGAWQLSWKLPWSFACIKHKCYLVSHCPSCERRLATGRSDRSLSPLFVRHVPKPGFCGNPKPFGQGRLGRSSTPCGASLANIETVPAARSALEVQKMINRVIEGKTASILGVQVSALQYFKDLRSLCALILYCAEPEDLGKVPFDELAAFFVYAEHRNHIREERDSAIAPRKSERTRAYFGCEESPLLMAAICNLATRILNSGDLNAMSEMLRPMAERCTTGNIARRRWEIMKFFHFSESITIAFHEGLLSRATFNRSIGNRSIVMREFTYGFQPAHVPQLLWEDDFKKSFAKFFPTVNENYARRFCSMSLVRLCGKLTWGDAAELLCLPRDSSIKMANRCVGFLTDEQTKKRFRLALHKVAKRLSENPRKKDYGSLRETLLTLVDIPHRDWLFICDRGGITSGQLGRRSKYAAVWLWACLTEGDWMLAPGLIGEDIVNAREVYRTLRKTILPKIMPYLEEYGTAFLDAQ